MPPTKPAETPRRARPTAILRQEPPTAGLIASRPSAALTGTKSISASPQLSIIASTFQHLHRLAALAVEHAQHPVHASLGSMKFRHSRPGWLAEAAER